MVSLGMWSCNICETNSELNGSEENEEDSSSVINMTEFKKYILTIFRDGTLEKALNEHRGMKLPKVSYETFGSALKKSTKLKEVVGVITKPELDNALLVINLLDEELVDEIFQDEINVALEDINVQEKTSACFSCETCGKYYKTKGGLIRHTRKKHSLLNDPNKDNGTATDLTPAVIVDLVDILDIVDISWSCCKIVAIPISCRMLLLITSFD
eukprot:gene2053-2329_t